MKGTVQQGDNGQVTPFNEPRIKKGPGWGYLWKTGLWGESHIQFSRTERDGWKGAERLGTQVKGEEYSNPWHPSDTWEGPCLARRVWRYTSFWPFSKFLVLIRMQVWLLLSQSPKYTRVQCISFLKESECVGDWQLMNIGNQAHIISSLCLPTASSSRSS